MPDNFADRLLKAIAQKGSPACVGVDPVFEKLPAECRPAGASEAQKLGAIRDWCLALLDAVGPIVPAVKPQSAYFEAYGAAGAAVYFEVVREARKRGLIVIGDVKRNDIGSTAQAYAAGHLGRDDSADAVTVNGYLGADGIQPFIDTAAATGRGLFVLVRTSNPSGAAVQDFADAAGRKLYEHVADQVRAIGDQPALVGRGGYSCVGSVVGATWPQEARALRERMPRQIFLVPGFGAQGATAEDCAASFKADGTGAIVNASRSVIFAHADKKYAGLPWKRAIAQAAREFADQIAAVTVRKRS